MKLKKIIAVCVLFTMFSGCSENQKLSENQELSYSENGVKIYLMKEDRKKLYRNENEGFEIACDDGWDIQVDSDGYLSKFVFSSGKDEVWLGVKKEPLETENEDINSLAEKYTNLLKSGIVKMANVTIADKKGKWIKVDSIDDSGIGLKDKSGNEVEIDRSNIVTGAEDEAREDIIFISDEKFAYVFLFHADNLNLYQNFESKVDSFLATFKFID